MSLELKIDVKYTNHHAPDKVRAALRRLMVLTGTELTNIFKYESKQRADGLGGTDGAVDTGFLSNSFNILSISDTHVNVGTRVKYARKLAFGEPDPAAKLEWIFKWRKRKNIPRRSKQVWKKVTTKGPTPNPFHERTKKRIKREWPRLQQEAHL